MTTATKNMIVLSMQTVIAQSVARAFRGTSVNSPDAVSDAMGDATIHLLDRALDSFDDKRGGLAAFVATVAFHVGIDCVRKAITRIKYLDRNQVDDYAIENVAAPYVCPDAPMINEKRAKSLNGAFAKLSKTDQDIFDTFTRDTSLKTAKALSRRTGLTVGNLRVRMHRLRKRMGVAAHA